MVNGTTPVRCGEPLTLANETFSRTTPFASTGNTQQTSGKLIDTRFYISSIILVDTQGNKTPLVLTENNNQSKGISLLDFGYNTASSGVTCSTSTYTTVVGKVKPGTYTGVEMTLGTPILSADLTTSLNHSNQSDTSNTPLPLQNTAMAWSWQSGRKFTKIEFLTDNPPGITKAGAEAPTANAKWNIHLGSTGCSGDPTKGFDTTCTNPNRLALNFENFDSETQKIALDVAKLYAKSDLTFEGGGAAGCMSGTTDPECPAIFKQLGIDLETGLTSVDSTTGHL